MIYNFKYLMNIVKNERKYEYEHMKLCKYVDTAVSNSGQKYLQHIVPIVYTITFICGCVVFIYKLL